MGYERGRSSVVTFAIAATLFSCGRGIGSAAEQETAPTVSSCGLSGFSESPSEHIVVQLEKPFRVRLVKGVIASEAGPWPEGVSVALELHPYGRKAPVRRAATDSNGAFKLDLPDGTYCFKATAAGWQSVVGIIVVEKSADPGSMVTFEMPLGV